MASVLKEHAIGKTDRVTVEKVEQLLNSVLKELQKEKARGQLLEQQVRKLLENAAAQHPPTVLPAARQPPARPGAPKHREPPSAIALPSTTIPKDVDATPPPALSSKQEPHLAPTSAAAAPATAAAAALSQQLDRRLAGVESHAKEVDNAHRSTAATVQQLRPELTELKTALKSAEARLQRSTCEAMEARMQTSLEAHAKALKQENQQASSLASSVAAKLETLEAAHAKANHDAAKASSVQLLQEKIEAIERQQRQHQEQWQWERNEKEARQQEARHHEARQQEKEKEKQEQRKQEEHTVAAAAQTAKLLDALEHRLAVVERSHASLVQQQLQLQQQQQQQQQLQQQQQQQLQLQLQQQQGPPPTAMSQNDLVAPLERRLHILESHQAAAASEQAEVQHEARAEVARQAERLRALADRVESLQPPQQEHNPSPSAKAVGGEAEGKAVVDAQAIAELKAALQRKLDRDDWPRLREELLHAAQAQLHAHWHEHWHALRDEVMHEVTQQVVQAVQQPPNELTVSMHTRPPPSAPTQPQLQPQPQPQPQQASLQHPPLRNRPPPGQAWTPGAHANLHNGEPEGRPAATEAFDRVHTRTVETRRRIESQFDVCGIDGRLYRGASTGVQVPCHLPFLRCPFLTLAFSPFCPTHCLLSLCETSEVQVETHVVPSVVPYSHHNTPVRGARPASAGSHRAAERTAVARQPISLQRPGSAGTTKVHSSTSLAPTTPVVGSYAFTRRGHGEGGVSVRVK